MKIIIFGANGMLGNYIYLILKNNFIVNKCIREDFDLFKNDWINLKDIINNYDIVINCIGIIPQKNEENIKKYLTVNSKFPHFLEKICLINNSKLIHITTDCVYNGEKGFYKNSNIHDSKNIYGISKSLGEPLNSTVIRTSIIGEELNNKKSFLEWVINSKKEINGYLNHLWNGVTCLQLAKIIELIIKENNFWKGVKNISSPNILNKYQLAVKIRDIYKLKNNIKPYYDIINKNMILINNNEFVIPLIEDQLKELQIFNIKSITPSCVTPHFGFNSFKTESF